MVIFTYPYTAIDVAMRHAAFGFVIYRYAIYLVKTATPICLVALLHYIHTHVTFVQQKIHALSFLEAISCAKMPKCKRVRQYWVMCFGCF